MRAYRDCASCRVAAKHKAPEVIPRVKTRMVLRFEPGNVVHRNDGRKARSQRHRAGGAVQQLRTAFASEPRQERLIPPHAPIETPWIQPIHAKLDDVDAASSQCRREPQNVFSYTGGRADRELRVERDDHRSSVCSVRRKCERGLYARLSCAYARADCV